MKFFTATMNSVAWYASVFVIVRHFLLALTITLAYCTKEFTATKSFTVGAPGTCIMKLFTAAMNSEAWYASAFVIVCHFLLALTNTLAYCTKELITATKGFTVQAPVTCFMKLFMAAMNSVAR
jgi:hypothetical protein